jgi:signal transduction histidine kinase
MANLHRNPPAVLIIEDDPEAQANLQDVLELDGYAVGLASSVRQVIEREELDQFSVILLDRKLPDGNGDDLLPHIKRTAPDAAVILITGYVDLDGAVNALRHGAADFLSKPIEPELLRFRLKQISEEHQMRQKLKEAQHRLIQSERLAAIGQNIAALSHEARNELATLKIGLSLLPRVLHQREDALITIGHLEESQDRLCRLFEEVRSFAAPIKLNITTCDVRKVWRKAWSSLEPLWSHRDASLQEESQDGDVSLSADAFRLEQVFRNLFENSLAACPDPVVIRVSCSQTSDSMSLVLSIRDNGPGLTNEQKQNVFDAFFTTKPQGTGLGMVIAKRIIEIHHGTIRVGDELAQGAAFMIILPLNQHCAPATESI